MNDHPTQENSHFPSLPQATSKLGSAAHLPSSSASAGGLNTLLPRLEGVKETPNGYQAKCPAHDDRSPSLSIREGDDGRVLLKCHAGCSVEAVVQAVGLELRDLFPPSTTSDKQHQLVAEYIYLDATKKPALKVLRYEPKDFRQQCWDGKCWSWKDEKPKLLYRLPELLAEAGRAVFVVEGEKDADRLEGLGFLATTNPGGAGKWRGEYTKILKDHPVVIIPDNDDAGREHALQVARKLLQVGCQVRILELDVPEKGDVSVWFNIGHTAEELRLRVSATKPLDTKSLAASTEKWIGEEPDTLNTPIVNQKHLNPSSVAPLKSNLKRLNGFGSLISLWVNSQ